MILQSVTVRGAFNLESSGAVFRCNISDPDAFIWVEVDDATQARKVVLNQKIFCKIDIVLVNNYR